jgi:phosphoribosylaminoimidazole carboxylase PurE protein
VSARVAILMGSERDADVMNSAAEVLGDLEVACRAWVVSAHRSPDALIDLARTAKENGIRVVIAGAGGAAHLPGVVASLTTLPVIGVPIAASLLGLDALLSIVQMPRGVPVATMAIGAGGAANAALLAARILALGDPGLDARLMEYATSAAARSFRELP